MRFPSLSQLDRDQTAIYQGARPDGAVLIVGPPGTGKSVIAFHRAQFLSKMKRDPRVIMFNKVLARYASNRGGVADEVTVSTLHSWAYGWWKAIAGPGAKPPFVDGDNFAHDWGAMRQVAVPKVTTRAGASDASWGHLIIDEGQDFPPAMYGALRLVMDVANSVGGAAPQLGLTVLADENQRLTPNKNSSLAEIRFELGLNGAQAPVFTLNKNYRNTKEIAAFAGSFYVGLSSGKPELPRRSGDVPVVSMIARDTHDKFLTACAEKIGLYAKSRRTEEIAVLVMKNSDRTKIVNRLKGKLDGTGIKLQTYASKDKSCPVEGLEFDTPGHVTVLNCGSAKGLEFDAVFLIDPGKLMDDAGSSELAAKMAMYVMCSRARSMLNVMLVDAQPARALMASVPSTDGFYEQETL